MYIARLIGPESFGLIGLLAIFISIAGSFVNSGFTQALVQKSHRVTEDDASTIFYWNMLCGVLMYVLLFFSAPVIADFYKQPLLIDLSRVIFLIILIDSFSIVVRAKLTIKIDFKSQALAETFGTILSIIISLYLVSENYKIWALVGLILSKAFFINIGLWFFCRWYPQLIFNMQSFRELFKFGSNLMLAGLSATLLNNLYVALIGRYFSVSSVGYFTQGVNISNFLSGFINSTLQGVTYPIMTSIKEDKTRLINVYKKLISITMMVSLPLLVGLAAVAESFVQVFLGEEWLPTVPVLIALCLARVVTPVSIINMNILNAIGRSDLFLKVDLSKYPMTLAGFFIGINYGIEGVAWAICITSFISFFIDAYFPGKFFGFGGIAQLKVAYKYIIASAVMFFLVSFLSFDGHLLVTLIAKIALGAIVYFSSLVIMRDVFLLQNMRAAIREVKSRFAL